MQHSNRPSDTPSRAFRHPRANAGDPTTSGSTLADDAISAFLHAPIGVAVCHPDGTVMRVNDAVTLLLGYPAEALVGQDLFRLVQEDLVDAAIAACVSLRDGTADTVVHETRFHTAEGGSLDVRVTTSAVRAPATSHPHAIMHLEDITDREDLRRRLQHAASHDPLTGLCNRVRFLDELQRALPRGRRHQQPVTVLFLDLDDFKSVNDTHGHAMGDQLLIAFSEHVRESVRPEDTAARLGGDEFAVLCEDTTAQQAALIVDRLTRESWAEGIPGLSLQVGVTVGSATSTDLDDNHPEAGHHFAPHAAPHGSSGLRGAVEPSAQGPSAESLLHRADAAMYAAKAAKRGS